MTTGPSQTIADGILARPVAESDAEALLEAHLRNREHLRPTEPFRPDSFYTLPGQTGRLADQVRMQQEGRLAGWVLVATGDERGPIVGAITLSNIVLGPLRSANLGYWVDRGYTGRGLATAAVAMVLRAADGPLGLHRVEAGTLVDNEASQRVLLHSGFELIGTASRFLHINGAWRDHMLFQRILNDRPPG